MGKVGSGHAGAIPLDAADDRADGGTAMTTAFAPARPLPARQIPGLRPSARLLSALCLSAIVVQEAAAQTQPAGAATGAPAYGGPTFLQIVMHTPPWVFALLAGLIVFGLMQVRTRGVAMWLALLLPAAMLVLSLSGVVQYVGPSPTALAAWAVGIVAGTTLSLKAIGRNIAAYDAAKGRLTVAGSWVPLLVILGIFCVRYAMGVARAMNFEAVRDANVQLAVSFLLGAFSGYFLARGIRFWRARAGGIGRTAG